MIQIEEPGSEIQDSGKVLSPFSSDFLGLVGSGEEISFVEMTDVMKNLKLKFSFLP